MTFGRHWIRHWIAVAAVVPLIVLGACSQDDPQPKFSPPSESPSASEPTPAEPVVRPWEKKTEAGAVAFAKHWIDVFNKSALSGDVTDMARISGDDCGSCSNFAEVIRKLYSNGGSLESDGWRVVQAVPAPNVAQGRAIVSLRIEQSAQKITRGSGQVERYTGGKVTYSARLVWTDATWVMDDLVLLT